MVSNGLRRLRAAGAAALVFGLSACGGGGGGDDPIVVPEGVRSESASPGSDVNSRNFDDLAEPLVRLVGSAGGSPAEGTLALAKAGRDAAALGDSKTLRSAQQAAGAPAVARLLRSVVQEPYPAPAAKVQALALTRVSHDCANGGRWESLTDDADDDGLPSPGDSIGVSFDDCRVDALALPADGGFQFTIDAVDLDRSLRIVGLVVQGRFDDLEIGNAASLDGDFTAWQTLEGNGVERYRFSYDEVRATAFGETTVYDVDIDGVFDGPINSYAIDGALGVGGQAYRIRQGRTFQADSAPVPDRGTIFMMDARGDTLTMVAGTGERLDFDFTPAGAAQPTAEWLDLRWSDFGI